MKGIRIFLASFLSVIFVSSSARSFPESLSKPPPIKLPDSPKLPPIKLPSEKDIKQGIEEGTKQRGVVEELLDNEDIDIGTVKKIIDSLPEGTVPDIGDYKSSKGKLIAQVESDGWKAAFAEDISETDVAKGVIAAGVTAVSGSPVFLEWVRRLVTRTISTLEKDLEKEAEEYKQQAIEIAEEAIYKALKGEKAYEILRTFDTVDIKAGAIKYSGRNIFAGEPVGPPTWGLTPYVAFRVRSSSSMSSGEKVESTISLKAINNETRCPDNGSFARAIVIDSNNSRLAIRCSKSANANINQSEYWTRPFMTVSEISGAIHNVQSASCPENRFVNEIVFNSNQFYIRCRYVNISSSVGKWSADPSFFTRPILSFDLKNINGAECPNDSAIAHVLKLNDGRLAIRCRRVIVDGNRLDINESDYWTRPFANKL